MANETVIFKGISSNMCRESAFPTRMHVHPAKTDQLPHSRSLIRVFADAQADLTVRWERSQSCRKYCVPDNTSSARLYEL